MNFCYLQDMWVQESQAMSAGTLPAVLKLGCGNTSWCRQEDPTSVMLIKFSTDSGGSTQIPVTFPFPRTIYFP